MVRDDQVIAAAGRVRLALKDRRSYTPDQLADGLVYKDVAALAHRYLAEHPDDDAEPTTEEWLLSVGFLANLTSGDMCLPMSDRTALVINNRVVPPSGGVRNASGDVAHVGFPAPKLHTRGDVRRLCVALGVKLNEAGG